MFDPIRELIAQNRLHQAFEACSELTLSASNRSKLIALRRRWDMISTDLISNTREERLIRIDENQLVQDLLAWLDFMDSDLAPQQRGDTTPANPPAEPKKKSALRNIGLLLLVVLGLGIGGTYIYKQVGNSGDSVPKERTPSERGDMPERGTTDDELKVPAGEVPAVGPMMTAGPRVKLTTAVYLGKKTATRYQEALTHQVARYLSSLQSRAVPTDVLTSAFHNSREREAMNLRGRIQNPPDLDANRAEFLLLIDFRVVDRNQDGRLSLSLYDVARKTGDRINKPMTLSGDDVTAAKQLARAANDYLRDRKERGLFN